MAENLVEARGLRRTFRRDSFEIRALDGIDLSVPEGEFLAFMGPSGSGKSTLLNLIAGIDRPTAGSLRVAGTEIASMGEKALTRWRGAHIGFIFQFYNLIPVLTAFENVELPLLLAPLSRGERRARVETALRIVRLDDRRTHLPRQLSGGEEQRVGIARAIVADPRLLLADEPTGDLDSRSAEEVLSLLKSLNEDFRKTIIMVTHDPKAAAYAHRVLHLDKGVLAGEGLPEAAAR